MDHKEGVECLVHADCKGKEERNDEVAFEYTRVAD